MSPRIPFSLNQRLVRLAARRTPADLSARLEEEWLSDLEQRRSVASGFLFAAGCLWATQLISLEHARLSYATAPAGAGGSISASGFGPASRRPLSFLLVVLAHAAVFAVLLLTVRQVPKVHPREDLVDTHLAQQVKERERIDLPPPIIDKTIVRVGPPPPDTVVIELPPIDPPPLVEPLRPRDVEYQPPQPPVHVSVHKQGGTGEGFPDPRDYYPSQAIVMGKEGVSVVRVCVNKKGKLTSTPTLTQSAGYDALDTNAVRLAQAGSGHYRPSTDDGVAVDSCYPMAVRFQLSNR